MSLREIHQAKASGEIEFFDLHPITQQPRFVLKMHNSQRVHIPAAMIEAAAGAYRHNRGEVPRARQKISAYGSENREFSRLIRNGPFTLPLKWNDAGFIAHLESDGDSSRFDRAEGKTVSVTFKAPSPEGREVVLRYRQSERGAARFPKAIRESKLREWKNALKELDRWWPAIVDEFNAGPFSAALSDTKPSELPAAIVRLVTNAYLGIGKNFTECEQ